MLTMSGVYRNLGLFKDARPLVEHALQTLDSLAPDGDLDVATALDSKGNLLKELDKIKEAKEAYEQALTIRRRSLSLESLPVASSLNWAAGVTVSGNYAYLADGAPGGLRIVNVSNPALPVSVGWYDTPGNAREVAVVGTTAYVADYYSLQVLDVSTVSAPRFLGSTNLGAFRVQVRNNIAYVASSGAGLVTVDVSTPANPRKLGGLWPWGGPYASTLGQLRWRAGRGQRERACGAGAGGQRE